MTVRSSATRCEIVVGADQDRVLSHFALVSPVITVRVQSGLLSQKAAEEVTSGHSVEKR